MILYSKPFVEKIEKEILKKTRVMKTPPVLGIVLVGNNPASLSYIKRKELAAKKLGCEAKLFHFAATREHRERSHDSAKASLDCCLLANRFALGQTGSSRRMTASAEETEIIALIKKLNADKKISGVIVQLPLPAKFNTDKIISTIKKSKDVDNLRGDSPFISPAVQAIWTLLNTENKPSKKANILIVGYGQTIGQPIHSHLVKKGFDNIIIADRNTKNLSRLTEKADVIISGAGKANLIKKVKKGAIVIDAGASLRKSKITGDVDIKSTEKTAAFVTHVPGGVGPLTVAYLFRNLALVKRKTRLF